jgi:hypothetical protein
MTHDIDSKTTNLMRVHPVESEHSLDVKTDVPSSLAAEVTRYAQIMAAGETAIEQLHERALLNSHIDESLRRVHLSCMRDHAEKLHRDIQSQNSQKSAELEIREFQELQERIRRDACVRALELMLVDIESSTQSAEKRAVDLRASLDVWEANRPSS